MSRFIRIDKGAKSINVDKICSVEYKDGEMAIYYESYGFRDNLLVPAINKAKMICSETCYRDYVNNLGDDGSHKIIEKQKAIIKRLDKLSKKTL